MAKSSSTTRTRNRRSTLTAVVLFGVVAGMTGLAFASVPLYQLFCQVTGFGGTPQVGLSEENGPVVSDRRITVRFDANVSPSLPWRFKPEQREVNVKIGESSLAVYEAANLGERPITGHATFNVTPYKAAQYFVKVACFCFDDQTLEAGQRVDMPVSFYVDPEILNDVNTRDVKTITLSYTFFRSEQDEADAKNSAAQAAADNDRTPQG